MNMWAVAADASRGTRLAAGAIFSRARASDSGRPQNLAPLASAWYSRDRDTAIWTSMAPIGARIAIRMRPKPPPPSSRSLPPPPVHPEHDLGGEPVGADVHEHSEGERREHAALAAHGVSHRDEQNGKNGKQETGFQSISHRGG